MKTPVCKTKAKELPVVCLCVSSANRAVKKIICKKTQIDLPIVKRGDEKQTNLENYLFTKETLDRVFRAWKSVKNHYPLLKIAKPNFISSLQMSWLLVVRQKNCIFMIHCVPLFLCRHTVAHLSKKFHQFNKLKQSPMGNLWRKFFSSCKHDCDICPICKTGLKSTHPSPRPQAPVIIHSATAAKLLNNVIEFEQKKSCADAKKINYIYSQH